MQSNAQNELLAQMEFSDGLGFAKVSEQTQRRVGLHEVGDATVKRGLSSMDEP